MAIGDCFNVHMGTGATNRQPASGVFEQLGAIIKGQANDLVGMFDGTNTTDILIAGVDTSALQAGPGATRGNPYNTRLLIGNTVYLRKDGTTDRICVSGVQVDA